MKPVEQLQHVKNAVHVYTFVASGTHILEKMVYILFF